MAENLFNREHKAVSDAYREGYIQIRWNDSLVLGGGLVTQRDGLVTQRDAAVYRASDTEDDGYAD